jgi:Flp pilus assembly pilin Flp
MIMVRLTDLVVLFHRDETGASLGEYAVLLLLIAVVTIAAISAFGSRISSFFITASSSI